MKTLRFNTAVLFALAFFVFAVGSRAQTTPDDQPIKVNTVLVNIPVIASDRQGRYVAGLQKDNFTIVQDGEKQEIEFFADDSAPMNVIILIDVSGSTMPFLDNIKRAARDFVKIFRPEDQGMIVTFASGMSIVQPFTSDQKKLSKAISQANLISAPGSNMQDVMYVLVKKSFISVKGRKAIIVLTDGMVQGKAITDAMLLNTLAESDVLVYPLLFKSNSAPPTYNLPKVLKMSDGATMTREEFLNQMNEPVNKKVQFMESLATSTGGKLIANKQNNFKESFQSIADELKNQYLIGFYPPNTDDGKSHNVSVNVTPKDLVIRTKRHIKLSGGKAN